MEVNAMGNEISRFYSASPDDVFEAAQLAPASLGYDLVRVDALRRTLSFVTTTTASDQREVTVLVEGDGAESHVVVTESDPIIPLGTRGRLEWTVSVPNRFIKAVTEILSRPSAGWLADPSGRFAQRWWDGGAWTNHARDSERGPQYQDHPGNLAAPMLVDAAQGARS